LDFKTGLNVYSDPFFIRGFHGSGADFRGLIANTFILGSYKVTKEYKGVLPCRILLPE